MDVNIPADEHVVLPGTLSLVPNARGLIIFAHGSGSSRFSPRNQYVAKTLQDRGFATLLFDLLTKDEEAVDRLTANLRFNIELLAARLGHASVWALLKNESTRGLPLGFFGASTGAAAALVAAEFLGGDVKAVVSRGGRPDLAGDALTVVRSPTLLIVGGDDEAVRELNERAMAQMIHAPCEIKIVPRATHLFEEPGALEQAARLAGDFFTRYMVPLGRPPVRESPSSQLGWP